MTRAIIAHTQTVADLMLDATNKDAAHRVGAFVDWMTTACPGKHGNPEGMRARRAAWLQPDLAAYRDHLLIKRDLAPASVAAHLSTVRGRYQALLRDNTRRQTICAGARATFGSQAASAADRKALVDETLTRLEDAVAPAAPPVRAIRQQDALDAGHVRMTPEQALDLLDAPARDGRNCRREALRDAALIALMLCTGLREMEVCALDVGDLRQHVSRQLGVSVRAGKGAKARFVPYGGLAWCLDDVDSWLASASITGGAVFRGLRRAKPGEQKPIGAARLSVRAVQDILKRYPVYADKGGLSSRPTTCAAPTPDCSMMRAYPSSPFSRIWDTPAARPRSATSAIGISSSASRACCARICAG